MSTVHNSSHRNEKLDFQDESVVTTIQHLISLREQIGSKDEQDSMKHKIDQDYMWNEIFNCDNWGDLELLEIKFSEKLGF